ncbi:MAG: 1-deoxy-D-xylulose-5-phosphate synthase, partial [Moraxellaceae bacterium]
KGFWSPGTLFEEMGFNYVGPINGHDLGDLVLCLRNLRDIKGPKLIHIITQKGKGFEPAELDPVGYHALNKIEPKAATVSAPNKPKYQQVFGDWLCDMAAQDERLIGITPAMCEGSGMVDFAQQYPDRFYDVAIAEQHAVTLAAGFACENQKPVVAIYSTFLQRAYDQLIHDVALQNLDVTFAIDRAGLVGEDGPTHAGSFDLSFLRCIPNMLIAAPSDENECRQLLYTAYQFPGPAAVRYPRGTGTGIAIQKTMTALPIGKGVVRREGKQVAILCFGTLLAKAYEVADKLNATLCDMRFVKPLDTELVERMAETHNVVVTIEENSVAGGAGSAVSEHLASRGYVMPVLHLGLNDKFVDHASHSQQLNEQGLDAAGIEAAIRQRLLLIASAKVKPVAG